MFDPKKEVPSLELCKRLKELGFPQDGGGWYWEIWLDVDGTGEEVKLEYHKDEYVLDTKYVKFIKAPTCREIGGWLWVGLGTFRTLKEGNKQYLCDDFLRGIRDVTVPKIYADTEPNADAKMLVWLVKNGHVKFEEGKDDNERR